MGLLTSYIDDGSAIGAEYSVGADYAGGPSAWSTPVTVSQGLSASIIAGPAGSAYLAVTAIPAGTYALAVSRIDEVAAGDFGDNSYNVTNYIVVADPTNGLYQLPNVMVPPDPYVQEYGYAATENWYVAAIATNGSTTGPVSVGTSYTSPQDGFESSWTVPPYFDGREQLKQNLVFLLREPVTEPFGYELANANGQASGNYFEQPANYAYAGFHDAQSVWNGYWISPGENELDVFRPFYENYIYENFVFNTNDVVPANDVAPGNYLVPRVREDDIEVFVPPYYSVPELVLFLTNSPPDLFQQPTTQGASIAPQLNNAEWLYSFPFQSHGEDYTNGTAYDLAGDGFIYTLTNPPVVNVTMVGSPGNYFGIPIPSDDIVCYSSDGDWGTQSASPGYSSSADGYPFFAFPQVAQPEFQTVEYDFWEGSNSLPGNVGFSPTNTSQRPMILAAGTSTNIACYAKLAVLNGYSGVYGYMGQYFTNAYQIDDNGNVTTNTTGILSPYGQFFATEPGPAALVTMPDIDTGQQGTGVVYCVSLQVDKNHDGVMDTSFFGNDATSQSSPMEFWVNDGCDVPGVNGDPDKDLEVPPATPNYATNRITCQRDLENFARLWICGFPAAASNGNYYATLTCNAISGSPAINLYFAETNGGTGYLTDTNVASGLVDEPAIGTVSPGNSVLLPLSWLLNGPNQHFMFEGAGIGEGQFILTIYQGPNVIAQTSTFIDLHEVQDFYEQPRASDVSPADPPTTNTGAFTFDSYETVEDPLETSNLVIYVHGLDNTPFVYEDSNATIFKRFYWEGYHGRYVAFRWPSPTWSYFPINTNQVWPVDYNKCEYIGWQSGFALKNYIENLRTRFPGYTVDVLGTSGGGVVANEAIRLGAQVDNFSMLVVSLPAECFDGNDPSLIYSYLAGGSNTPDADSLGGYNNCFTNLTELNTSTRLVNFYNDDDYALYRAYGGGWEYGQKFLRPDHSLASLLLPVPAWYYSFDGTNCFLYNFNIYGGLTSSRLLTQDFEKKSYVARSRTKAVGAAGLEYPPYALTAGVVSTNISLQDATLGFVGGAKFGDSLADHSGEFTKPIQDTTPFYKELLNEGFLIAPSP